MRNKTDRNDARGIAQLVRLGWFRQVHVKSEEAQRTRMLLVNRQQLSDQGLGYRELSTRGSEGFRPAGRCRSTRGFEARVLELVANDRILLASPSQCCAFAMRSSNSSNGSMDSANSWRGVIRLPQADDRSRCRRGCGPPPIGRASMRRALSRSRDVGGAFRPHPETLQFWSD